MKKMIMAMVVACATAMVQAASVSWTATATSAYNGQTIYLLTAIQDSYDTLAAFEATAVDSGSVAKSGPSYKVPKVETKNVDAKGSFYLAVLDTTDKTLIHYQDVTSVFQGFAYEPPASAPGIASVAFADIANSATTVKIGGVTPPGPGPDPVPEPTSGLLLVLGGAALALRRRR